MQRILILGGGVGGTLTANLLVRKLRRRIDRGEVEVIVVDATGQHVYQPGFMYIAMGGERAANLQRPERSLLDKRVTLVVGEVASGRRGSPGRDPGRRPAARLRLARARDRIADRARGDRALRHRGPSLLHRRGRRPAAHGARRVQRRPDRHRHRRDALQVPAGAARGRVPHRIRAARPRAARRRPPSTSARRSAARSRIESVSEMATPILEEKGIELHTFFNVEAIDPERKVVESLEGEELGYDLLILVPPHKGQQFLMDSGLAPAPGGWLPTDRHTLQVGGRPNVYALGDATDLPLSKAGSTAHFEAPVVAERIAPPSTGHAPGRQARRLPGQGHVLLRDRRWQGHAPPVRLRPSAASRPSRTTSGTWARSSSTRRTGIRCPRVASDAAGVPYLGPSARSLPRAGGLVHRHRPRRMKSFDCIAVIRLAAMGMEPHDGASDPSSAGVAGTDGARSRSITTMRDIARVAGVSQSTVSRVLNDAPTRVPIAADTRERVLVASRRLGIPAEPACAEPAGRLDDAHRRDRARLQ